MTTPQDDPAPDQAGAPTVSTAPSGGETTTAPGSRWWRWGALPDHLGRARTSTVILAVLFLAIFTLYLNVRPDNPDDPRTPAGGGDTDVNAPLVPGLPTGPSEEPEPTGEPAPTTTPEATRTPTSTPPTSAPGTSPTAPTSDPDDPSETSGPASPTDGTTEPGTSSPATTG